MERLLSEGPDYGNWVSKRLVFAPGAIAVIFMGFALILPFLWVFAALFLMVCLYFAYARYIFSPKGGTSSHRSEISCFYILIGTARDRCWI